MQLVKHSVAVVLSGTKMPRGGLTSSALNRATQLADRGYAVHVYTFDYRPNFEEHVKYLREQGLITERVNIHNFYDELKNRMKQRHCDTSFGEIDASLLIPQRESRRLVRYFTSRGQFLYSELQGEGKSLWRRYYSDTRVEKRRVEYSLEGTLHRETVFADGSSNVSWFSYLDDSGRAYFTQWMDELGNPADVFAANEADNGSFSRYGSLAKAQKEWFHSAVSKDVDGPLTVMLDDCTMAPIVKDMPTDASNIIAIFHNDHKTAAHKPMIDAMASWHAVVCSTRGQSHALRDVVPDNVDIISIAQPVPDRSSDEARARTRRPARFAFFGRLNPIKNVVPLVKCFAEVLRTVPAATLDIFGSGPLESELQKLITDCRLQGKVHLMGRTDNAPERMSDYTAIVVPSAYEAFGLVIGEAMLAETPVIAFDCDFGPRDIITTGVDGVLVGAEDFKALEIEMINLSNDPDTARRMGKQARANVLQRFSNDRIMGQWENLMRELMFRKTE